MKRRSAALVLCGVCLSVTAAAAGGLCTRGETTYFSCPTRGNKTVALCAAPQGGLQYRFGRPGRIELAYPQPPADSAFAFATYARYQVWRNEVSFGNDGILYTVFDYSEDGKRLSGVRVTDAAHNESERRCTARPVTRLIDLQDKLPCDTDNALNVGGCR